MLFVISILTTYIPIEAETSKVGLSEFEVSAICGIDGIIKSDKSIPVDIKVKSKKKDFTGSIKFIFMDTQDGYNINYKAEVELVKNKEKTISFITSGYGNYYRIQLCDEQDNVVYQNEYSIAKTIESYSSLIGILSENCEKLSYFKDIELIKTNMMMTSAIYLDANNFPVNIKAMEFMDYLIIDNFDSEKLSKEQYNVLMQWVENGGNLIIALGENYEKSYQIFQQEYPITADIVTESLQLDKEKRAISISGVKVQGEGWQQSELLNTKEMFYQRTVGKGCISLLGFQLSNEALVNTADNSLLASAILTKYDSCMDKLYNQVYSYFDAYDVDISFCHDIKAINIGFYVTILFVYVLIIGPGLYILFKRKNKIEKLYLGVGVIAIAFTILLGTFTYDKRVKNDIFTSLTIFDDVSNQDASIYTSYLPIQYGTIDIQYNEQVYDITLPETELAYYDTEYVSGTKKNNVILVEDDCVAYSKEKAASFEKIMTKNRLKNSSNYKTLECDLNAGKTGVRGTVRNVSGYDLEDVVVYYLGSYIRIAELKKDAQYTIKSTDTWQPIQTQNFSNYFQSKRRHNRENKNSVAGDNDKILDYIYNHNIAQASNTYVYVFGIVKDYKADYVKGTAAEYNKAAVMTQVRSNYMEFAGYYVDAGNTLLMDSSVEWITGSDGKAYNFEDGYCTYMLSGDMKPVALRLSKAVDESRLLMKLYNYETQTYDEVFKDGKVMLSEEELPAYFNDGEFKIQYVSVLGRMQEESRQGVEIPRIDILASNE